MKKQPKKLPKWLKTASERFSKLPKWLKITLECFAMLVWVFIAVFGSQYLVAYPLLWIAGREWLVSPVGTTVYSAIAYTFAMLLIILVPWKIFKKWKTSREELGLLNEPTWTDIGLAPIGYIASLILAWIFTAIFSLLPWFNATETQNVGFESLISGGDRLVAFITLVIVAPIAEEIIFRGWLYGKLRAKISMIPAMLIVSTLFGIVHGQWNVGVTVFAISLVLCFLRETTGTIYSGILVHMLKNGIAFFLLYMI